MGKIVRILNHNAVIVHDAQDNRVLLLLDKGIGFGKKINEQMDPPYSGKIYELQKETSKGPTKDVLNHLEPQYLEISSEILTWPRKNFMISTATSCCLWQITLPLQSRGSRAA